MLIGSIATIEGATRVKTTDIRLGGKTRIETGLKSADQIYTMTGKFKTVIVAYSQNFPDALSGGYLAKTTKAPIILTNDSNTPNTLNYIKSKAESKAKVYLLGGSGVVGSTLETKLKQSGFNVIRLGGSTRYETNLKILTAVNSTGSELLVASGKGYADSLSGSSVGKPILIVGDNLTNEQKVFVKNNKFSKIYILGGSGAVSKEVESTLKTYATVERIGGLNRFETSKKIADRFFPSANTVVLASAHAFPDGLTGGSLGGLISSPVLLVSNDNWEDAHNYVVSKKVTKSFTMGGEGVISNQTVSNIMTYYEGDSPKHTHVFAKSWSKDATYHWHKATCSFDTSCKSSVKDKAKHSFKEVKVYQDEEVEIIKTEVHTLCNYCNYDFHDDFEKMSESDKKDPDKVADVMDVHFDTVHNLPSSYHTATVEVGTGEYETIQVLAGRRYECSVCGYIKQD